VSAHPQVPMTTTRAIRADALPLLVTLDVMSATVTEAGCEVLTGS
jgi:hypothetical protein